MLFGSADRLTQATHSIRIRISLRMGPPQNGYFWIIVDGGGGIVTELSLLAELAEPSPKHGVGTGAAGLRSSAAIAQLGLRREIIHPDIGRHFNCFDDRAVKNLRDDLSRPANKCERKVIIRTHTPLPGLGPPILRCVPIAIRGNL